MFNDLQLYIVGKYGELSELGAKTAKNISYGIKQDKSEEYIYKSIFVNILANSFYIRKGVAFTLDFSSTSFPVTIDSDYFLKNKTESYYLGKIEGTFADIAEVQAAFLSLFPASSIVSNTIVVYTNVDYEAFGLEIIEAGDSLNEVYTYEEYEIETLKCYTDDKRYYELVNLIENPESNIYKCSSGSSGGESANFFGDIASQSASRYLTCDNIADCSTIRSLIDNSHSPVTIHASNGNGLSITSQQVLSLALASASNAGALSAADFIAFSTASALPQYAIPFGNASNLPTNNVNLIQYNSTLKALRISDTTLVGSDKSFMNFQYFTPSALLNQGSITWNTYWNGSSYVRDIADLTSVRFAANTALANADASFFVSMTNLAGTDHTAFTGIFNSTAARAIFNVNHDLAIGAGDSSAFEPDGRFEIRGRIGANIVIWKKNIASVFSTAFRFDNDTGIMYSEHHYPLIHNTYDLGENVTPLWWRNVYSTTGTFTNATITNTTLSGKTLGSVLFVGTSSIIDEKNAHFFWDNTNNRLGIGVNSSLLSKLHIVTTTARGIISNITYTNTQATDYGNNFTGTITGRATTSDIIAGTYFNNSFISGANTQSIRTVFISTPTFTNAFTAVHTSLWVNGVGTSSSNYIAQFHSSTGTSNTLLIRNDGASAFATSTFAVNYAVNIGGVNGLNVATITDGIALSLSQAFGTRTTSNFRSVGPFTPNAGVSLDMNIIEGSSTDLSNFTTGTANYFAIRNGRNNAIAQPTFTGAVSYLKIGGVQGGSAGNWGNQSSGIVNGTLIDPVVNQSGTGAFRGHLVFPSITAAADWRSYESILPAHANNVHLRFGESTTVTAYRFTSNRNIEHYNTLSTPAAVTDGYLQYSEDIVAGNAIPKFKTEAGDVISLFKGAAITAALTNITFTAPGTPNYTPVVTNVVPYGFATADDANTVLSVIRNLQDEVADLKSRLQANGLTA